MYKTLKFKGKFYIFKTVYDITMRSHDLHCGHAVVNCDVT